MKQRFLALAACVLFSAAVAFGGAKPRVHNHITPEGSRFDPLITAAYADTFEIVNVGSDGYERPKVKVGGLPVNCRAEDGQFIEGYVAVAYVIALDGRTTDQVVIETSDARLNETALAASRQWVFAPARIKGKDASTVAIQTFKFRKPEK